MNSSTKLLGWKYVFMDIWIAQRRFLILFCFLLHGERGCQCLTCSVFWLWWWLHESVYTCVHIYRNTHWEKSVLPYDNLRSPLSCSAVQVPLPMGFPRQKYWSRLPFPSRGDLPNPGIEPGSPALEADALTSEPPHLNFCLITSHPTLKTSLT